MSCNTYGRSCTEAYTRRNALSITLLLTKYHMNNASTTPHTAAGDVSSAALNANAYGSAVRETDTVCVCAHETSGASHLCGRRASACGEVTGAALRSDTAGMVASKWTRAGCSSCVLEHVIHLG